MSQLTKAVAPDAMDVSPRKACTSRRRTLHASNRRSNGGTMRLAVGMQGAKRTRRSHTVGCTLPCLCMLLRLHAPRLSARSQRRNPDSRVCSNHQNLCHSMAKHC